MKIVLGEEMSVNPKSYISSGKRVDTCLWGKQNNYYILNGCAQRCYEKRIEHWLVSDGGRKKINVFFMSV